MSSTQLAKTINRVNPNALNNVLNNFNIVNSITTQVDGDGYISDLKLSDADSNIQTLLSSCQNIMNVVVARGLATYTTVKHTPSGPNNLVQYNYFLPYNTGTTSTLNMIMYSVNFSYFYTASGSVTNSNSTTSFAVTSNTVTYASDIDNAEYIAQVQNVVDSLQQLLSLIADIVSTGGYN